MRGQVDVAMLTIIVLVIVVSTGIVLLVRNTYNDLSSDVPCVTQIIAQNAAMRTTGGLVSPTITCPSKRVDVQTTDENAAKEAVAHEMARCWAMWRQGNLQLFDEKGGIYCHVCSVVNVSGVSQLNDFPQYLDTHDAIKGRTYSEYLVGVKTGTYFADKEFPPNAPKDISAQKPISVIFYYAKGQQWYKVLSNNVIGQPGTGVVAGGVGGGLIVGTVFSGGLGAIAFGTLLGATGGGAGSILSRQDLDHVAATVARPLDEQNIQALGCTYAPVAN